MRAISCFPKSNFLTGQLEVVNEEEKVGACKATLLITGATILWPAVLAITIISQIYFLIKILIHNSKIKKLTASGNASSSNPFVTSSTLSEDGTEAKLTLRVKKLDRRINQLKKVSHETKDQLFAVYHSAIGGTSLSTSLKAVNPFAESTPIRVKINYANVGKLERKLRPVIQRNRWISEKEAYLKLGPKRVFELRSSFAEYRHKIAKEVCNHYLTTFFKLWIPGFGIYWLFTSKETTKAVLDRKCDHAISEYNRLIDENTWLKPY